MKRLILAGCLVGLCAGVCVADHYYGGITHYSGTKLQIPVTNIDGTIRYVTTGTCRVFINVSSAYSFPVVANTVYEATTPVGINNQVTRYVFKCVSAAAATNTIKVIK